MSLSDEPHPFWGRQYSQYTTSYTNEALSAPLISNRESHSQTVASETISHIRKLGISRTNASVDHITLPMLMDLHEEVRDPGKLRSMADPGLVSGCVRLMASVKPSALQYEYGYVSFRILVIALNACSMKHLGYLEETIAHMNSASLADRLSTFWGASSWLFYQKSRANQPVIPAGLVDEAVLDQLLNLLYHDEKLFLVVSKRTCSLGLSGLMSVFLTHATDTKKRYRSQDDHHKQVIRPYVRIFWRYLVVISNAEAEEIAVFDLQTRIAPLARLYHEKPVDVEDSVNLVRALNDRLASIRPASALIVAAMLRFVAPMVVPGCEELIPTTVKLCIEILWNSLSSGTDAMYARQTVLNFLLYLRDMLMALKPPQFNHQPWIWEVVDHVIKGDVLDLALRVFSTVSGFNPSDLQGTEGQLFSASIEAYIAVSELAPVPDLMRRFEAAGSLDAWSKCYFYFRVNGTEITFRDTFAATQNHSVNWACGEIIAGVMSVLIGSGWEEFVYPTVDSCDNPRCAMPCYAQLVCSRCDDLVYCTSTCAALDWSNSWGGLHRSVCRQHARQPPSTRKYYHRFIDIPPGFNERAPSAVENSLSGRMINHIRGKWSGPKPSILQGVMLNGDYRNAVEFQDHKPTGV